MCASTSVYNLVQFIIFLIEEVLSHSDDTKFQSRFFIIQRLNEHQVRQNKEEQKQVEGLQIGKDVCNQVYDIRQIILNE